MEIERQIEQSLVRQIRTMLTADGWTNVSVPDINPDRLYEIVTGPAGDYEVSLPAISIRVAQSFDGPIVGLGDTTVERLVRIAIFDYALTAGQEKDLRGYLHRKIASTDLSVYDFSGGFPGDGNEPVIGPLYIENVSSSSVYIPMAENPANRFAGAISILAKVFV